MRPLAVNAAGRGAPVTPEHRMRGRPERGPGRGPAEAAPGGPARRVLVVDDDPAFRSLLERTLARRGYEVLTACDGVEGLAMARAHRPLVIVTDAVMPVMDGFDLCRKLRRNPVTSDIPVLMLTVLRDERSLLHGFNSGADDFVTKPFHPVELLARVQSLIERRLLFLRASGNRAV